MGDRGVQPARLLACAGVVACVFAALPTVAAADTKLAPPVAPAAGDLEVDAIETARDAAGNRYVEGELLVSYEGGASTGAIQAAQGGVGAGVAERYPEIDAKLLDVPAARGERLERLRRELERDPAVDSADYNYLDETFQATNDPLLAHQWGVVRIRAPQAWPTSDGDGSVIAVLDSGLDTSHPDIGGVIAGADFFNEDQVGEDNHGHGTHVTGIAAALTDNGVGVAGTSPEALIVNAKVCEADGQGSAGCPIADQIQALVEVADYSSQQFGDIDVVNMSLGGPGCPTAQRDAVNYAAASGIVVVAAAGNDATDVPACPAFYANAIAVSGTTISNTDSDFSNFGSWIDVSAPGGNDPTVSDANDILSTVPGGYAFLNGTSMASPFVAGVASLLDAQGRGRLNTRNAIESTAIDLGDSGFDVFFGHGLVNAQAAVQAPKTTVPPPSDGGSAPTSPEATDGPSAGCKKAKKAVKRAKRAVRKADTVAEYEKAKRKLKKAKKRKRRRC